MENPRAQIASDKVVQYVRETCARSNLVEKLVLFGSRARGTQKERSDYDFALEFRPEVSDGQKARLLLDLQDQSPTLLKLDLIELSPTLEQSFREAIARDGVDCL